MRRIVLLVLLLLSATAANTQEVQVPFDDAGKVRVVDRRLAIRLGVFLVQYPEFDEARLLRAGDSTYVLQVWTAGRLGLTQQREMLTGFQADSLRHEVMERLARLTAEPAREEEGSGRAVLIAGSTLLGFGFYGWAIPVALDASASTAVGLYMITSALSYSVPFALTQDRSVSYGAADLTLFGASRGIAHGFLFADMIQADRGDAQYVLGPAIVFSLLEGGGGYLWADRAGIDGGTAGTIATGGDFGLGYGLGIGDLTGLAEGSDHRSGFASLGLAGSAAGIVAGRWLASRRDYSYGDAAVMRAAGLVVAYGALAAVLATESNNGDGDSRPQTAAIMAASLGGLVLGDRLVKQTEFSYGQSILVNLGTVAGGLFGLGIALLATSGSDGDTEILSSAIGAAAGYAGSYAMLASEARHNALRRDTGRSSLQIQWSPAGALGLAGLGDSRNPAPLVTLHYAFD